MGRKKLSEYPPEVAAKMRADLSAKMRAAWAERNRNGLGCRKNGALTAEVQEKISESVRKRWEEGTYDARVNGMTGVVGPEHPGWTWGKRHFREILEQHEEPRCALCGREDSLNAHHIDENHGNYLLSNLQWACVTCHAWRYHYGDRSTRTKAPFVMLTKRFGFEYAHILPWHPGKCARLHGHSGKLSVRIRARLDPNGVVEDFYDIGAAVKTAVIEPLDHTFLNDVLPNPTSEELLVYIWRQLESIGLKGLWRLAFSETDSSSATISARDMVEAHGWVRDGDGKWVLVRKTESVQE